jgi:hypothetical protein
MIETLFKILPKIPYNSVKTISSTFSLLLENIDYTTSFSYLKQLSELLNSISMPISKIAQLVFLSCYKSECCKNIYLCVQDILKIPKD